MSKELSLKLATQVLNEKELDVYTKYLESGKPPLSKAASDELMQLFFIGHSCEEIAKLNPGFGYGIVLRARVDNLWDQKREEHLNTMLADVRRLVQQSQLEAIKFAADGMAAFQKMVGEKFQRYIQTGDEKALGEFKDMSFKHYRELVEMITKLTTQPQQPQPQIIDNRVQTINQISLPEKPKSSEAFEFLKALEAQKKSE